jgi:hypothetical protein
MIPLPRKMHRATVVMLELSPAIGISRGMIVEERIQYQTILSKD